MKQLIPTAAFIACLFLLQSCASFKSHVTVDMQSFSDNTNILFNEAVKVSQPFQFKTLSTYTNTKEYAEIKQKSAPLIHALKGTVYYSNQLVAISNSSMSERGKNEQLVIYLGDVLEKVEHKVRMDSIGLTHSQIEFSLSNIKAAESYREGIEAADPIVKTIVLSMFEHLDEMEALIDNVISSFNNQIYLDFESAIDNYQSLKELQNSTQRKLTQLYFAQSEDNTLVDTLIQSDSSIIQFFPDTDSITQENYDEVEDFLFRRLNNIDIMLRQLDDDKAEYIQMKEEVSRWHGQVNEKISTARNSMIVWSQSHKNLGKGIETPPLIGVENFIRILEPAIGKATAIVL